jgi:hypothetical protein
LQILGVADDWPLLALLPPLFAEVLDDHVIVAKAVLAVPVFQQATGNPGAGMMIQK